MKLTTKTTSYFSAAAIAGGLLFSASSATAATINYVGNQDDVESASNTTTAGWRNATPAKPLDIDGDNILGTDGWAMFGTGKNGITTISLPSYVGGITHISTKGNSAGSFGVMDDPADPSGADTVDFGIWHQSSADPFDIFSFSITGTGLDGQTLRVGIAYDTYNASGAQILKLTQTTGGSATATSPTLTFADDGMDVAFFDITNASAGDVFTLNADETTGSALSHAGGITFDTVIPEPGSLALLGLGGLLIARRRRA